MPSNLTYSELLKSVPAYMERRDDAFKEKIPLFVNLAENRIATDMKQQGFLSVVTGTLSASQEAVAKPAFWRETVSFSAKINGRWIDLKMRSLEYVKRYWPEIDEVDTPAFYADYNAANFYIAPTPDADYEFELSYYARLQPLGKDNDENWLTVNAPQVLLYATLWEAAMWVKNPAAEQRWMQQYQIATGGQLTQDDARKEDRNVRVKK